MLFKLKSKKEVVKVPITTVIPITMKEELKRKGIKISTALIRGYYALVEDDQKIKMLEESLESKNNTINRLIAKIEQVSNHNIELESRITRLEEN